MDLNNYSLTSTQSETLVSAFERIRGKPWSLDLPVFLLNRCWMRLEQMPLENLLQRIPPDNSAEAPELVRYYQLIKQGHDPLIATQECWAEFGIEDFHRAIRNFWYCQDLGNNGWTFKRYLLLLDEYRKSFDSSYISMPLIQIKKKRRLINKFSLNPLFTEERIINRPRK